MMTSRRWRQLGVVAVTVGAVAVLVAGCAGDEPTTSGDEVGAAASSTVTEQEPGVTSTTAASTASSEAGGEADSALLDQDVQATFELYRTALAERDGAAAAGQVTESTFTWYEETRDLALTAGADALLSDDVPLMQALTAIRLRSELGDQIATMTGEELLVWGVDSGLVGDSVGTVSLEAVEPGASGEAFGLLSGFSLFRFAYEGEAWKVDLPYTISQTVEVAGEDLMIQQLSGGEAATREELFVFLAPAFGTTWDEVSQPLA